MVAELIAPIHHVVVIGVLVVAFAAAPSTTTSFWSQSLLPLHQQVPGVEFGISLLDEKPLVHFGPPRLPTAEPGIPHTNRDPPPILLAEEPFQELLEPGGIGLPGKFKEILYAFPTMMERDVNNNTGSHPHIALDQFNNHVPPGWRPGMRSYTFRRYAERLKLWQHVTQLSGEQVGPAIAGRLTGRPYDIAMGLQITDENGVTLTGDMALAYVGFAGTANIPTIPNGPKTLLRLLDERYGQNPQEGARSNIEDYLNLTRGNHPLLTFLIEEDYRFGEAQTSGMAMNSLARTHFVLRNSGITESVRDHILLLVDHDMSNFAAISRHLHRIAQMQDGASHPSPATQGYHTEMTEDQGHDEYDAWLNEWDSHSRECPLETRSWSKNPL